MILSQDQTLKLKCLPAPHCCGHQRYLNVDRLLIGSLALFTSSCPTASSSRELHTVGLNTRQVFRACTFYLVFKEPAHSEVLSPRRTACSPSSGELTQNTEPCEPCQHPFRCRARPVVLAEPLTGAGRCRRRITATLHRTPLRSKATRARRTGLPATRRVERTTARVAPSPESRAATAALYGDAGAPGKTFESSRGTRGCQPPISPAPASRFQLPPLAHPTARVSVCRPAPKADSKTTSAALRCQPRIRAPPTAVRER